MGFTISTSHQGLFAVTESSITRFDQNGDSESQGLLVRRHYDEVQKALWVASIMKEGGVFESRARYVPEPGEPPVEDAPRLAACLNALERFLSLTTDGEYEAVTDILNCAEKSPT